MADVVVRLIPLPPHVGAIVSVDEDEVCNIYINSRLPDEARREALDHELEHIRLDHIYAKSCPLSVCEAEASQKNKKSRVRGLSKEAKGYD